jgi:hypothetical protein
MFNGMIVQLNIKFCLLFSIVNINNIKNIDNRFSLNCKNGVLQFVSINLIHWIQTVKTSKNDSLYSLAINCKNYWKNNFHSRNFKNNSLYPMDRNCKNCWNVISTQEFFKITSIVCILLIQTGESRKNCLKN